LIAINSFLEQDTLELKIRRIFLFFYAPGRATLFLVSITESFGLNYNIPPWIYNDDCTEWSAIWSEIKRVVKKLVKRSSIE
jgi:hypothetical protein